MPKYPKIKVEITLHGPDGNAFVILGRVQRALRHAKVSENEIDTFLEEAMSGGYDNLLQTCRNWVEVS